MDQQSYENWIKVKKTFEELGNTNNMYYQRACAIVNTRVDPLAQKLQDNTNE